MKLRRRGTSIGSIEKALGIPRSTLSNWFRSITLTDTQKLALEARWRSGLVKAREKAAIWHNEQKKNRIDEAKKQAEFFLSSLEYTDQQVEIALAFLYLGEGAKADSQTALGNSNPLILKFFIASLTRLYNVPRSEMKCYLHLRADQDEDEIKIFWSNELSLPIQNFGKTSFDIRTEGKPTYPTYKGVCIISCSRVAIVRRLRYIADGFCMETNAR